MVFGAEHRRLYAAGMQLLDTCARNKAYGLMAEADVRARGAECVETTNQNSSDLMVFAAYVQARAKEVEGPKAKQMSDAVAAFNRLNQQLVEGCNGMMKELGKESRQAFIKPIQDIDRLTRAILDLLTPPEDSDIFQMVQSMSNQKAGSLLRAKARLTPLDSAALKLKKELQPLKLNTLTPAQAREAAARTDRAAGDFAGLARAKVSETSDAERRARMAANLAAIEKERGNVGERALATPNCVSFAMFRLPLLLPSLRRRPAPTPSTC